MAGLQPRNILRNQYRLDFRFDAERSFADLNEDVEEAVPAGDAQ